MSRKLVEFTKMIGGNLRISLTEAGRERLPEVIEMRDEFGIDAAFLELIGFQLGNGWEEVKPEEVGALTASMILTDEADRDDLGILTRWGGCTGIRTTPSKIRSRLFR
jgi:hypothetical protein